MGTSIGTRRYYYIKPAAMFRHNGVARPIFPPYPMTWETGREDGTPSRRYMAVSRFNARRLWGKHD